MLKEINKKSKEQAIPFGQSETLPGNEIGEMSDPSQNSFSLMMTLLRTQSICLTLIVLGFLTSIYVLWRYFVLAGLWPGRGTDVCLTILGVSCDSVLVSPASFHFGLPLAGWGLIYYAALAALLLLAKFLGDAFAFEAHLTAFLLSLPASLISLGLVGMMLTGHTSFCSFCALAHFINLALVYSLYRLTGRHITQLIQPLAAGGSYLLTGKAADLVQARWKLTGLFAVALFTAVLYQRILILAPPRELLIDPQQLLAAYEKNVKQDIPVGNGDPILGPANAPVQIVVFSDFQCPACRRYAPELHTLAEQYGKKLQVVFKHYPLNKACNPAMKGDLHPRACEAAYAAEAARKQGKFWSLHDKMFATDLQEDPTVFDALAQDSGIDIRLFKSDSLEESTKAKVLADIELASRLKVNGTPTLFLNRRPISDIRPQAVRVLIDHELEAADN